MLNGIELILEDWFWTGGGKIIELASIVWSSGGWCSDETEGIDNEELFTNVVDDDSVTSGSLPGSKLGGGKLTTGTPVS